MHKLNLAWHLAFIVLLGTVGAVVCNLPYTYIEAFRTESTKQAAVFHEDPWSGNPEATVMAGWPIKYLVKLENANTGPFTTFNWIRLLGNVACWAALTALIFHYERRLLKARVGQAKSNDNQKHKPARRNLSLLDLLIATGVVAAAIGYWQSLKTLPHIESPLLGEISQRNGRVVKTTWLPQRTAGLIKRLGIPLHEMAPISEVTLSDPTTELLKTVLELPYLRKLYIGGGQYDLRLLDRLAMKPLLTELRISGRELDPQAIAAIGQAKQLVMLNLMRTNVNEKAIQSFTELNRLSVLNLIHTDVNFETLGKPACANQLVRISVPRPAEHKVVICDWPKLEHLVCNEFDQPLNDSAATIELSNLPRLKSVGLDCFQSVNLQLKDLPELHEIYPIHSQFSSRLNNGQSLPDSIWLQKLTISNVPKLSQVSAYAGNLDQLHFSEPMLLELRLNSAMISSPYGLHPTFSTTSNVSQWIKAFEKGHGPNRLYIDGISLEGIDISPLASNERLSSLGLSRTKITESQIVQVSKMNSLEEIDLTGNAVNGKSIELLAAKMPMLRKIACDRKSVQRLRLEQHSKLSHLFQAKDELFQGDALRIVDMPALTETFDLPSNLLLLHIDGAPSLTGLSLRSPWSKKFILRGVRDLQYFAAGGAELDVKSFDELLVCKNLKHLVLAYTKLPSEELRKIANLHELQSLTLSGSDVDNQLVSDLTQLDKLKSLRIDDTKVTDAVMESVAKFSQLEQLSLHKTQVSGIGLGHLSSLKNFKQLHFGNNPIGTQEMQAIVDCKSLKVLDLSGSQLSADSLAVLVNNPPPSLERLGLNGAIVEGRGLTTLVRKLPDLRIAVDHAEIEPQQLKILLASRNAISESTDEFTDLIPAYESLSWLAGEFNLSSSGEVDPRVFAPQSKDRLR